MLLRSSSTPIFGSLLSSFSENPNNNTHYHSELPPLHSTTAHHNHSKLSFNQAAGSLNFTAFSCNSSPISPDVGRLLHNGVRRAQSEGNLEGLVNLSSNHDQFCVSNPSKKYSGRTHSSMLETIPSFSFGKSKIEYEDEDSEEEEKQEDREELDENGWLLDDAIRGEERFDSTKVGKSSMVKEKNMDFNEEMRYGNVIEEDRPEMYLAKGLGVSGISIGFGSSRGGGGGGYCTPVTFDRDGGDSTGLDEHYKRMVEENPSNPLFLRNYAEFLYESKQDLQRTEEYYSRAILADPKDGEILSQYAKLVWELHRDKDRATSYFERAVQASFADSHVHAAYASFLWEIEEDDDDEGEDTAVNDPHVPPLLHKGDMTSATA